MVHLTGAARERADPAKKGTRRSNMTWGTRRWGCEGDPSPENGWWRAVEVNGAPAKRLVQQERRWSMVLWLRASPEDGFDRRRVGWHRGRPRGRAQQRGGGGEWRCPGESAILPSSGCGRIDGEGGRDVVARAPVNSRNFLRSVHCHTKRSIRREQQWLTLHLLRCLVGRRSEANGGEK